MQVKPAIIMAGIGLLLTAETLREGPQVATFFSDIDDTDQPYALYVPKAYSAEKKYPLVISLHGAGSNHRLNLRRVFGKGNLVNETDAEATRYFPKLPDIEFIVASPLARGTMGYQGIAEHDVYDVLADVKKRFSIDEDRVYLTGLSMGGGGALWLGLTRPDIWAAAAPVCAAAPEQTKLFARNALNVPMHLFQGSLDPVVPVESSRAWRRTLLDFHSPVEYTEYPNVRHNAWDYAYKNTAIFEWFSKFRRNRFPERVRFSTDRYKYRSAYWVQLDGLTPGTPAGIDAKFTGTDRLEIVTSNLLGFTLKLNGHPLLSGKKPLIITIDGQRMKSAFSFTKVNGQWQAGSYAASLGAKRPGEEGPVTEALSSRHVYVYGTDGSPEVDDLKARRAAALEGAEWSKPRSRLLLALRALSDKEVIASKDLSGANLILFGTKETNELIRRFDARLPLSLNAGAADYGLVFIYPIDGRLALINSGLPWWTGADQLADGGLRFVPMQYRVLDRVGDFVLFKGSLENIVAEGYFTNDWKLPEAAAQKMKAAGAVEVR
jgi:pimeloyl-ACP methyl ester carboxylesterase